MLNSKSLARRVVPLPLRRALRNAHRNHTFRLAIKKFLQAPAAAAEQPQILRDLIYGWGNEAWSASEAYLQKCLSLAQNTEQPILECGSGLSTLLLGIIAREKGNALWSLEHDPFWGNKVEAKLREFSIQSVHLHIHPLRNYGEFSWYAPPLESMPEQFSLVICDGPPGDTPGARYGLVPVMRAKLKPGTVILLDDAGRAREREIAGRWAGELHASVAIIGSEKPYAEITVRQEG